MNVRKGDRAQPNWKVAEIETEAAITAFTKQQSNCRWYEPAKGGAIGDGMKRNKGGAIGEGIKPTEKGASRAVPEAKV